MVSVRRRRNLGLSSGNNSCQIGTSSTPYGTLQPQKSDISNEIGTSSKMADNEKIPVPHTEASFMVINSEEPTASGVQRYNQPSEDQSLFTDYDPSPSKEQPSQQNIDALSHLNDPVLVTTDLTVIDHFVYGDMKPFPAFLGPIFGPKHKPKSLDEFFPSSKGEEILASLSEYHVDPFRKKHLMQTPPPFTPKCYVEWLDRIQQAKSSLWIELGIFDFIQLSRRPLKIETPLIAASLFFWSTTTNNFHFQYGMMGPTLFDIAAITGLRPDGAIIDPRLKIPFTDTFDTTTTSFTSFIEVFHSNEPEVSDEEHIAFLLLWLSAHVFCNSSVCIDTNFVAMAILINEGIKLALSQYILADFYHTMSTAVANLRDKSWENIGGPIWLLQLWFNAVLAKQATHTTGDIRPNYGTLLYNVSWKYPQTSDKDDFVHFFNIFLSITPSSNNVNFFPFVERKYGPEWFTRPFEPSDPDNHEIWSHYLCRRMLLASFPGSEEGKVFMYLPNTVARQMGLCQGIPAPYSAGPSRFLFFMKSSLKREDDFSRLLFLNNANKSPFMLTPYTPLHGATRGFKAWWESYYSSYKLELINCLVRITSAFAAEEKFTEAKESVAIAT